MSDERIVAWQLGRPPRGRWRTQVRCRWGAPVVIVTTPTLDDGTPFPTLCYLTCPHLRDEIARLESDGATARWRDAIGDDVALAGRMHAADASYRAARLAEGGGVDPSAATGIAGQADPLAVKCLHAHAASFLAGFDDPVGEGVLAAVVPECADDRCRAASA